MAAEAHKAHPPAKAQKPSKKPALITPARKAQLEVNERYQDKLAAVRERRAKEDAQITDEERQRRQALGEDYLRTVEWLDTVEAQLLHEFVGWDQAVRRMMSAARKVILDPEEGKTQVVPLISFPGYGKTTIIQRFLKLLNWESRFLPINVKKGQTHLPYEGLLRMAENPIEKNLPQAVVLIDEIQNLTPVSEIEAKLKSEEEAHNALMERLAVGTTLKLTDIPKFEKPRWYAAMEPSFNFYWQILGNGKYQPEPRRTIPELIGALTSNIASLRQTINTYKLQQSVVERLKSLIKQKQAELETDTPPEGTDRHAWKVNLRSNIQTLEQNLIAQEQTLANNLFNMREWATAYVPTLYELLNDHPEVLGEWKDLSPEDLFDVFASDTTAFVQRIRTAATQVYEPKTYDFSRTIIFVTANPEKIIDDIKTNLGENSTDPNALHAAATQVRDSEIERWFNSLMGVKPGAQSRWNLNDWRLIAPFNADQWHELVDRRLERFSEKFEENLEKRGQPHTRLEFHRSVHDLLYKACVDPLQGPRNFFPKTANLLWTSIVNLTADIMRLPKDARPEHLVASFNSQTNRIEIYENVPDGEKKWRLKSFSTLEKHPPPAPEGWRAAYAIGVDAKDKPVIHAKRKSLALQRQTVHQAGQAVVGMTLFKSMPQRIIRNLSPGETGVLEMWSEPDLKNHDYQRKLLMTVLGGYVAAHKLLGKVFVSEPMPGDIASAKEILAEMLKDTQKRREVLSFLSPDGESSPGLADIVPHDLAKEGAYPQLLAGDQNRALEALYREVESIVSQQEKLIGAIANRLQQGGDIEPDEIQALVVRYMRSGFWFSKSRGTRQKIVYSTPGDAQMKLPKSLRREYRYGKLTWWEQFLMGLGLK